jgi:hypothetical protein
VHHDGDDLKMSTDFMRAQNARNLSLLQKHFRRQCLQSETLIENTKHIFETQNPTSALATFAELDLPVKIAHPYSSMINRDNFLGAQNGTSLV